MAVAGADGVVLLHCLPHSPALCRGVGVGAVAGGDSS